MSTLFAEQTLPTGQKLRLFHGDLTAEKVDAIVNAANAQLLHGGGLAAAIVRRGGSGIQDESNAWVREYGPVSHEQPALTSGGTLPCQYIIHAVGPKWGEGDEDAKLHAAVISSLFLAAQHQFKTIALPAISTGIFGFPKDRGAAVILDAISGFCSQHPAASLEEIRITLIDEPSVRVFTDVFAIRWPESVAKS